MDIWIVSGFRRSGTSAMMLALMTGGMKACYQIDAEDANAIHSDDNYKVNPGGLMELAESDYKNLEFPDSYQGNLIKCLWGGLARLRESENVKNIIMMRRPIKEIASSCEAVFGKKDPLAILELDGELDALQEKLMAREDVRLTVIQYHDVVKRKYWVFNKLADAGWPINPCLAAGVIKPEFYRHRQCENLNG